MKTIRRLYFYLVAFVSLEVVAWALISLGRSMVNNTLSDVLAGGLAFILVGLPVFLFHWRVIQRDAVNDDEERFSGVRTVFLYTAWISLAIPVIQNFLAIVLRILAAIFDVSRERIFIGGEQGWADNIIAILVNAVLAAYIYSVIKKDWQANPPDAAFPVVRRLNRYLWVLYGLGLTFSGVFQLLQYLFDQVYAVSRGSDAILVSAIGLILLGVPVWVYCWRNIQMSISDPASKAQEQQSQIRRGVLYSLTLLAVWASLLVSGIALWEIFRMIFNPAISLKQSWSELSFSISVLLPSLAIWAYHWKILKSDIALLPNKINQHIQRRLYFYLLSLTGLIATFIALQMLVSLIGELIFCASVDASHLRASSCDTVVASLLPNAIAVLLISVPLWVLHWRPAQMRALQENELGENARSSLLRKIYLYLLLFAGVLGSMFSSGWLLYEVISALLNVGSQGLLKTVIIITGTLILFLTFTIYHWRLLRQDGIKVDATIAAQQQAFPVVVVSQSEAFGQQVCQALSALTPNIPQIIQNAGEPLAEGIEQAKAVILSANILITGDQALDSWLRKFNGARLVLPASTAGWMWLGLSEQNLARQARQAAKAIEKLAEVGEDKSIRSMSSGKIIGYVLAVIFGLSAICTLTSLIMESL